MDYAKLCSESRPFVDMTLLIENYRWHEVGYIVTGEKGCGKSTILSMMYYYFSVAEDSRRLFSDKKIASKEKWDYQLNSRPVVLFSFEGLLADTYENMIEQIFSRVREQCMEYLPGGFRYRDGMNRKIYSDEFLDVIEGKYKKKERCLWLLIRTEWTLHGLADSKQPIVLLDEPFWPLEQARRYGYEDKMCDFLQQLLYEIGSIIRKKLIVTEFLPGNYSLRIWETLEQSVYERSGEIFLTREEAIKCAGQLSKENEELLIKENIGLLNNRPIQFARHKTACENAGRFFWEQREVKESDVPGVDERIYPVSYIEKISGFQNNSYVETDNRTDGVLSDEIVEFVRGERQRNEDERLKWHRYKIAERKKEKRHYRKPLPEGILIPTEYLGIRKLPDVTRTAEYNALNYKLRELYRAWEKEPEWDGLYRYMQKADMEQHTDWNRSCGRKVADYIRIAKKRWDCTSWDDGGYWGQLIARKGEHSVTCEHIKIYASTGNIRVKEIFLGAVKLLLSQAENSFAAKVSNYMRKESMCFWVRNADRRMLEDYFADLADVLVNNLDFIAYRGKLGYSRETHSGSSHNQWQAELMKGYFKRIGTEDKIELSDMYQYLIDAWNNEIRKGDSIAEKFKNADAQILIMLLETFFIIIKNKSFNDDNILLTDDNWFWEPLCCGKNWEEVGNCYIKIKKGKYDNQNVSA